MVTAATYADRFNAAISLADPNDSVDKIKRAVIDEMRELDPRVSIQKTDYFNHTFAPDLVASWGNEGFERYIYIRSDMHAPTVLEDLHFVQDNKPILFGISPEDDPDDLNNSATRKLAAVSQDADTLVTDISGVAGLIDSRSSKFLKLVSSSFARGGRGLLDANTAAASSARLQRGLNGALNLQAAPTREALSVVNDFLNDEHSKPVQQLLQAVWVGAGGSLTEFPGESDLSGSLSDDVLLFLLNYDEIEDGEFWSRIGESVTLEQLSRLSIPSGSVNLDHFFDRNLDKFRTRCLRVKELNTGIEPGQDNVWFTESNLIGLKQPDFYVYFADRVDDLEKIPADKPTEVTVGDLRARAGATPVTKIELTSGDKSLDYSSGDDTSVLADKSLSTIAGSFDESPSVRRVEALSGANQRVYCDLYKKTATGRTSGRFLLLDLARTTVPLLHSFKKVSLEKFHKTLPDDDVNIAQTAVAVGINEERLEIGEPETKGIT